MHADDGADHAEFVSEPIRPEPGTFDTTAMSRAEPGLPGRFTWREAPYEVAQVLATWKTSSLNMGELYLRRHWFKIETTTGEVMTLYCERQARSTAARKARWWLYCIDRGDE